MGHVQQCKETKKKDICVQLNYETELPRELVIKNLIHDKSCKEINIFGGDKK